MPRKFVTDGILDEPCDKGGFCVETVRTQFSVSDAVPILEDACFFDGSVFGEIGPNGIPDPVFIKTFAELFARRSGFLIKAVPCSEIGSLAVESSVFVFQNGF